LNEIRKALRSNRDHQERVMEEGREAHNG
jgi:hypothetical protein